MATKEIKDLTSQTSPASTDLVMIQQSSDDASRKSTLAQVVAACAASTSVKGAVKQMPTIADLNQYITEPVTDSDVQAISDKIDELLGALRTAGVLAT